MKKQKSKKAVKPNQYKAKHKWVKVLTSIFTVLFILASVGSSLMSALAVNAQVDQTDGTRALRTTDKRLQDSVKQTMQFVAQYR